VSHQCPVQILILNVFSYIAPLDLSLVIWGLVKKMTSSTSEKGQKAIEISHPLWIIAVKRKLIMTIILW
jgi:hypothetical protein